MVGKRGTGWIIIDLVNPAMVIDIVLSATRGVLMHFGTCAVGAM